MCDTEMNDNFMYRDNNKDNDKDYDNDERRVFDNLELVSGIVLHTFLTKKHEEKKTSATVIQHHHRFVYDVWLGCSSGSNSGSSSSSSSSSLTTICGIVIGMQHAIF